MFNKLKFQLARLLIKGTTPDVQVPFMSYFGQRVGNYLMRSTNEYKYMQEYRGWVYACITARTEGVKNIKLHLYQNLGNNKPAKEILDNPVLDLLNYVNPAMTRTQLFEATQAFLDLDGNAFWWLARANNGKGDIEQIYVMSPDRVTLIADTTNPLRIMGYSYTQPDGNKIPFDATEVLHFKNFNPVAVHPFPHRGMGIVEAASWAIDTENAAKEWNYNFFANSARPDGILYQEGVSTMGDDDYARLRAEWEQNHQGQTNAHKIAILSGGIKWQEISRNQKDMDFNLQRQFGRD